jgi:penicillin-binding protein 1A
MARTLKAYMSTPDKAHSTPKAAAAPARKRSLVLTIFGWLVGLAIAGIAAVLMVVGVALAMAYPNLPEITALSDYRPKLPLRVFSAEGELLAEFGEERRELTPIAQIPQVMKDAVLAAEDSRFFDHGGVDYLGMVRAGLANFGRSKSQGASTISMQVARNVYLTAEKTYTRKIYEVLLTFKLEHILTKEQILEIYMNQIFLGHRAYGFAAASQAYYGKPLKDVTVDEAAMLAGLPKAPSAFNPISNPKRARARQLYIIDRMLENGFIDEQTARTAKDAPVRIRPANSIQRVRGDYAAEMVRQAIFEQYGDEAYTRGLNVTTTIRSSDQQSAYKALRSGLMEFERRQRYRGPEKFVELPMSASGLDDAIDQALADFPDNGDVLSALVLDAKPSKVTLVRQDGVPFEVTGDGLKPVQSGLADKAPPNIKLRRGAVVRVVRAGKAGWEITQLPEVEGAFVALDPRSGSIRALVGGFDFQKNKFNHVTQAWRQPGSSFKPFVYSAALEKGITPSTIVYDSPLFFSAGQTGGKPWEPKNYDGKFEGPMPVRTALAKSKNMVSIRILQAVGAQSAQDWVTKFGFDADKHPPYLTMALGAGAVTPIQMVSAYSVFANGGHLLPPTLISKVTDTQGRILLEAPLPAPNESNQVISERNAFLMSSLLQEITRSGTAAKAQATLKRPDLYGKTGTTNDAMDAWFVGFQPTLAAAVWVGYDNPKNLGSRETGGGLSLPIWITFMQEALKGVAETVPSTPEGITQVAGEWYFNEFSPGNSVKQLGTENDSQGTPGPDTTSAPIPSDERKGILDLFRN